MDLEFSTKFPGIATELLTPLLLISEVTGWSLIIETDNQLRFFLLFHRT
jgi:hypothetical protein